MIFRRLRALLFATIILTAFTGAAPAIHALGTAWAASPALDEAQQMYDTARFADAVTRLRQALSSGEVAGPDALKAKELLGRCLVKSGDRVGAKEAFKSLLREDSGYRLDRVNVPPDELQVFDLALKEITAEQIEAGQRVPASIGGYFGWGSGNNSDLGKFVKAGGGNENFDTKLEFGGSVRFPLRPRLSLDIEILRFRATNEDSFQITYVTSAIPLIVNAYWTALPHEHWRVNLFGGVGPMLASRASIQLPISSTFTLDVSDEKVGLVLQAGAEGEYFLGDRISVSGRVLARSAKASGFFDNTGISYSGVKIDGRDVDYSGFGAFLGLRAYIGY